MLPLERALGRQGYEVLNLSYRSRTGSVATLAADVASRVLEWRSTSVLDFVTHSLGGILLRAAVADGLLPGERIRRVVMLGPPNRGSELADVLPKLRVVGGLYARITGVAGSELGTGSSGVAARLPPVPFELGVIAGNRSLNPLFSAILREPNDGKVRVSSTRVDGMRDFLVVPHWHPLLMAAPSVVAHVLHFLACGRFNRALEG
jgi:triacylglycerol lipase